VQNGVNELLVISQDTSAYGVDIKHAEDRGHRAPISPDLRVIWARLGHGYGLH